MCEFTTHYSQRNAERNLKSATTNGLNFWIINSLIGSWGVRLTCLTARNKENKNTAWANFNTKVDVLLALWRKNTVNIFVNTFSSFSPLSSSLVSDVKVYKRFLQTYCTCYNLFLCRFLVILFKAKISKCSW